MVLNVSELLIIGLRMISVGSSTYLGKLNYKGGLFSNCSIFVWSSNANSSKLFIEYLLNYSFLSITY
jgi:hypothetical protein